MSSTYDRRAFLRRAGLAGAAAFTPVAVARPPALADESLAPFVHGVASGDPTADGVLLWTRLTVAGAIRPAVRWRVATDVNLSRVVAQGESITDRERDFTVTVDVGGLEPSTWYFYEFTYRGKRSLVGRTKTAPSGSVDHLRFGVASCSNYEGGYFNAYARLAERDDLDAILHLGDYVYEYGPGAYGPGEDIGRTVQPAAEMVTLDQYRRRFAFYRLDPDLRRLHQLFPFITVWDDHESTNDSWSGGAENHQDDEGAWAARKAVSQRVYSEWLPMRAADPATIYRRLAYGDLVDLVMLDTRLDGRDQQVGQLLFNADQEAHNDPDRQLLSPTQREFLQRRLAESPAQWKVLGQQVMIAQWNAGGLPELPAGLADMPGFLRSGGNAINPDAWDGYTAERTRLLQHLVDERIDNVVVLTGDIHTSWANDVTFDPYNPTRYNPLTGEGSVAVEFVTPSVTSDNFDEIFGTPAAPFEVATRADNPHVKYVDFAQHGYLVLDVTPERAQSDWFFVDTLSEPSDSESFGAAYAVRAGENHVVSAEGPALEGALPPATPTAQPRRRGGSRGNTAGDRPGAGPGADGGSGAVAGPTLPATGGGIGGGLALLGAAGVVRALARRREFGSDDNV